MRTNVENIWLEDEDFRHSKALRIDFKNDYHIRVIIHEHTPEALNL